MKLTAKNNQIQLNNITVYPDTTKKVLRNIESDEIITDSKQALKEFFKLEKTLAKNLKFI